jgi:hydrogenase maturation protease
VHQLFNALSEGALGDDLMSALPLVIGIGSDNGDDSAGWTVVGRLHELGWPIGSAIIARHPAELLDWCDPGRELIVCDACEGSGDAGDRRCFVWPADELPASPPRSSHEMSLTFVLKLGRTLDRVPASVTVRTLEGRNWLPNTPISPFVKSAAIVLGDEIHASAFRSRPPAQH